VDIGVGIPNTVPAATRATLEVVMVQEQPRFGISIPQIFPARTFDPAGFRDYLAQAEAHGFASAWTSEQILGTVPYFGPIETLSFAAACTTRIRLGCAALVSPHYSPLHLAKSLGTLDHLSQGRLEVAVTTGAALHTQSAFGVQRQDVFARFAEGLRLIRAVWSDERTTFPGRFWQVDDGAMEPKPWQESGPPVWFAGSGPQLLRRAAREAHGFIGAGSATTAQFSEQVRTVRSELATAGRAPASFPIAKRVYIAVDDDLERGRTRMADALQRFYGFFGRGDLTAVATFGPPTSVHRAFARS
jgi:alkanesulfonate monooxygenase SsuD/methylene tetrahydromethanopterin reductase-like flavin-dependent oxidoreductase (luciferase family)